MTAKEIADAIKEAFGYDVDKKKISMKDTIKNLGEYTVEVRLFVDITAKVKVVVQPE